MFNFSEGAVVVDGKEAFSIDPEPINIPSIEVQQGIVEYDGEEFKRPITVKKGKDGKIIGTVVWLTHKYIYGEGDYEDIPQFCFDIHGHKEYWG